MGEQFLFTYGSKDAMTLGMCFTKLAADDATLKMAGELLRQVHDEEPSFWPNGLSAGQFDGGLWLLSKSAGAAPIGFVGWQDRNESGRRIGYYAIGVLPEHRGKGYAKSAVSQLLQKKASSVDEVRALVCSHNAPSLGLARSLGVTVIEKSAAAPLPGGSDVSTKRLLAALAGAVGTTVLADQAAEPERSWESSMKPWEWDKQRGLMGTINAGLGAIGGHQVSAPGGTGIIPGITAMTLAPTKDLVLKSLGSLGKVDRVADQAAEALARPPAPTGSAIPRSALLGALGLGVGGLGIAAYMAKRKGDAAASQAETARAGRVKVTLPTKNPGDAETTLDLPINELQISQALKTHLGRDARRKLLAESRERTRRRKPRDPNNPTANEQASLELDQEEQELENEDTMSKVAGLVSLLNIIHHPGIRKSAAAAPPQLVPTPPPLGTNPATRMTQQQVAVNSIDTSTDANPQIMKAQQDAAAAEQQASQQAAQSQQEAQGQQMQQEQKFNEERMQMQQDQQLLKMQIESAKVEAELAKSKSKMESDLVKAQGKAQADALKAQHEAQTVGASDENSLIHKQTFKRLGRLQNTMMKGAGYPTTYPKGPDISGIDPNTGKPAAPAIKPLRPGALGQLNSQAPEAYATNKLAPTSIYRTSYGSVGDIAAGYLRDWTNNPQDTVGSNLSPTSILTNPDPASMLETVSRLGHGALGRPILSN